MFPTEKLFLSEIPLTMKIANHIKDTFPQVFPVNFVKRTLPVAASERWKMVKPKTLQRTFFTQVTGNRLSDHYARNFYIKVFL